LVDLTTLDGEKYPQGTDAFQSVYLLSPPRAPILLVFCLKMTPKSDGMSWLPACPQMKVKFRAPEETSHTFDIF
jgi:hypothetical protein